MVGGSRASPHRRRRWRPAAGLGDAGPRAQPGPDDPRRHEHLGAARARRRVGGGGRPRARSTTVTCAPSPSPARSSAISSRTVTTTTSRALRRGSPRLTGAAVREHQRRHVRGPGGLTVRCWPRPGTPRDSVCFVSNGGERRPHRRHHPRPRHHGGRLAGRRPRRLPGEPGAARRTPVPCCRGTARRWPTAPRSHGSTCPPPRSGWTRSARPWPAGADTADEVVARCTPTSTGRCGRPPSGRCGPSSPT